MLVHLAFIIMGGRDETRSINLEGSRNVFEAAAAAGASGSSTPPPSPPTASTPTTRSRSPRTSRTRGTDAHYYSAQKAELEDTLRDALAGATSDVYVFRPCIVAGGDAMTLVEAFPKLAAQVARAAREAGAARTRARRSSSCTPRTSRPRWPPRCAATARPASTTSRARGRSPPPTWRARSAGCPCRCRRSASTLAAEAVGRLPLDARAGVVDQRDARAGGHGHLARAASSSAGSRCTTPARCSPTRRARPAGAACSRRTASRTRARCRRPRASRCRS